MRAQALQAWAKKMGGFETHIHQTLEGTHPLYHFGVHLYNFIQKKLPLAHHLYFNYLELVPHFENPGQIHGRKKFQKVLREQRPDIVLSTHAHLNHGFFQIAKETFRKRLPLTVTYCGELHGTYGFSRRWVNPKADHFLGAVPETCKAAHRLGMPPERNHCAGFLLRPQFYKTPLDGKERQSYLQSFGLNPDKTTLILGTGANSANNHLPFLKAIQQSGLPNLQIVALCGKSERLYQNLHAFSQRHKSSKILRLPYLDKPANLFQSADALLCRPGTGLTSEAILCGIPILHNTLGGTMPQEAITLAYCRKHGLSHQISKPSQLPALLHQPGILQAIRKNLEKCRPPSTPADILCQLRSWHSGKQI